MLTITLSIPLKKSLLCLQSLRRPGVKIRKKFILTIFMLLPSPRYSDESALSEKALISRDMQITTIQHWLTRTKRRGRTVHGFRG